MDYYTESLKRHQQSGGKLDVVPTMPVTNQEELSLAYTPGIAEVSRAVADGRVAAADVVSSRRMVAVVTDGSAVLGLGDIGPAAALPVMEGKAALFKEFADVTAFPIAINTQDVDEFVETVINIAPTFGGINLEDIAAPRCFEIEERLIEALDIPVFHDDQHGTAIVVLAGLINALKVVGKERSDIRVVITGAGAAGTATARLLHRYGVGELVVTDSHGILSLDREDLDPSKRRLLEITNQNNISGSLRDALTGADVFIGVSRGGILGAADIQVMADQGIVFAMANPEPEIMPEEAVAGGAAIVATGRSDFPNQLNNVLVFPGIFRGAFDAGVQRITDDIKVAAAHALAALVPVASAEQIIPGPFTPGVADAVAGAVQAVPVLDRVAAK
ncbi:NAD-dependent malic enzyme [bacterium]|nr:NAD-dependent malic enzyme [bacterium]